jgi:hypothetical protein
MRSLTGRTRLLLIALSLAAVESSARAEVPQEAVEAYIKAYTQMGKNSAVLFANQKTQADTRLGMFNAWISAQCQLLDAQGKWITSVANVNSTNAKTMLTLQEVRKAALDNSLKTAKTFYEKRKCGDDYHKQNPRKRPTCEAILRYSQASLPKRLTPFELASMGGRIRWPGALQGEEFSDGRIRLECLFAQRQSGSSALGGNVAGQVQTVTAQMREQLQSKIRQMSPTDYVAARKFLTRLAYEVRRPAVDDRVASN